MTDWKDTVMSDGQVIEAQFLARQKWLESSEGIRLMKQKDPYNYNHRIEEVNRDAIKEDQAEKSFKTGKQAGMKEIVEWINSHSGEVFLRIKCLNGMTISESSTCLQFYKEEWQAFLKEKGIGV